MEVGSEARSRTYDTWVGDYSCALAMPEKNELPHSRQFALPWFAFHACMGSLARDRHPRDRNPSDLNALNLIERDLVALGMESRCHAGASSEFGPMAGLRSRASHSDAEAREGYTCSSRSATRSTVMATLGSTTRAAASNSTGAVSLPR